MLGATHCAKHFFYHCHITATTLLRGTLIKRINTNGSRTEGAPGGRHLTSFSLKEENTTSFYYNKSKKYSYLCTVVMR